MSAGKRAASEAVSDAFDVLLGHAHQGVAQNMKLCSADIAWTFPAFDLVGIAEQAVAVERRPRPL